MPVSRDAQRIALEVDRLGRCAPALGQHVRGEFDLVVIGAGPAGEKGAIQAAYYGHRVAVVEHPLHHERVVELANDALGLFVKFLGQFGKHAAAKNAGFLKDDVLVELNGQTARITEGEMIGRLLRETKPGDKLKAVVLRGDKRIELLLPMQ